MLKPYLSSLRTVAGVCGLLATALLGVVVWFFAPALLGVEALWLLLLLAVLPLLVFLLVRWLIVRRAMLRDAALVAGATQTDPATARAEAAAAAAADEERAVAARLADALAAMRTAGGGKAAGRWNASGAYLYERPWYVMIGPPGAGKTTAIRNSGLSFPLAEGRVSGVGGTRNCDWWIAEQAVLIDTAGRYTTQDSDAQADKAGWERFLDLLRRERPRQPLNGVIVTLGVDMLSRLDAATREQHAQAVRRRVRELEQKLAQRLPVYFVVSKTDLVAGFTEFFADLDRDARAQVWGATFKPDAGPEGQTAQFAGEFALLGQRLQARLLQRLQAERGAEQRTLIAGFPAQFMSLQPVVGAFLQAAFGGSSLDPAPQLRGVYFTSGTQEGTPIDRLTGALSRTFGLDPQRPAAVMGQKGRSYFLGRLLLDMVFNEASLAARDPAHARRQRLLGVAGMAAGLLLLVGGLGWGWAALHKEAARDGQMALAVQASASAAQGRTLDRVAAGDDLASLLPVLDSARALPAAAEGPDAKLGLSQQQKLATAGKLAYDHALDRVLLPRLLARLEQQMRDSMQRPADVYLATRVYLMLGRQGPLEASLVQERLEDDWARAYPGAVGAAVRERLAGHLQALLQRESFATYALDGVLVDQARRAFSRLPPAERVFARLRNTAGDMAPWRAAVPLGPAGQRLFAVAGGKPATDAVVPGLFTVEGLHRQFLPRLPKAIADAAKESWVLGPGAPAEATNPAQLEEAVLRLYAQGYIQAWQALFDSLELAPFGGPAKAAEALNVLGAPNSPLKDLLRAASRQLSPGTPPAPTAAEADAGRAAALAASAAKLAAADKLAAGQRAAAALGAPGASAAGALPAATVGTIVETHFQALREASGAPLDTVVTVLNELYVQVARVASSAPGSAAATPPAAGLDPGQRLLAEAQRAPEPLARWLRTAGQSSSTVRAGGARAAVAAAAAQQLAPFCRGVEARFPFKRDAAAPDMPMDDFVRLFGPGGALDLFFNQNLKSVVDTSQRPWRAVVADGGPAPVSPVDIAQFQRAAAIRDAFFPAALPGQAAGNLRFELQLLALDPASRSATLEADGTKTALAPNAAARAVALAWPARSAVTLSFDGEPTVLANDGPWAALRFVARGRLQPTAVPDRLRLAVQAGARSAEFELRTSSIVHPFGMRELAEFRCPQLAP